MTRDEFMKLAKDEVDIVVGHYRNRLVNLIERAWAEGKKAAEIEGISEIVKAALEQRKEADNGNPQD